jgi:hypothetical protein
MQTRSQTRMLMESYMANHKKATRSNKNNTCCCTDSSKPTKAMDTPVVATPVKSTKNNNNTPVAPNAPMQTRYRTRSSTNTITNSTTTAKKNLAQDFDAAFFDESSTAWNENKKKLGNGMYAYRTRSTTRK